MDPVTIASVVAIVSLFVGCVLYYDLSDIAYSPTEPVSPPVTPEIPVLPAKPEVIIVEVPVLPAKSEVVVEAAVEAVSLSTCIVVAVLFFIVGLIVGRYSPSI